MARKTIESLEQTISKLQNELGSKEEHLRIAAYKLAQTIADMQREAEDAELSAKKTLDQSISMQKYYQGQSKEAETALSEVINMLDCIPNSPPKHHPDDQRQIYSLANRLMIYLISNPRA